MREGRKWDRNWKEGQLWYRTIDREKEGQFQFKTEFMTELERQADGKG